MSVNNTTLYFIYNKSSILSGRHVSAFIRSSSGLLGKQIQELSIFQCIVGSQMLADCVIWMWNTWVCICWNVCDGLSIIRLKIMWGGGILKPIVCFVVYKRRCCVIDWHVFIIINIKDWTLWSVPTPGLQLLSPTFFRSSNWSSSLRSVVVSVLCFLWRFWVG